MFWSPFPDESFSMRIAAPGLEHSKDWLTGSRSLQQSIIKYYSGCMVITARVLNDFLHTILGLFGLQITLNPRT